MCDVPVVISGSQTMGKKHNWQGDVIEDRSSPSRFSLDSGFSSFPASPSQNAPPPLIKHEYFDETQSQNDLSPPLLVNCAEYEENDEPAYKMPRLSAVGEEDEIEDDIVNFIKESSIQIDDSLSSVPEKEIYEPKPEAASVPSESNSVIKSTKRVRISTPEETVKENEDPYAKCLKPQHPCKWANCVEEFFDVNDLYDHTIEKHFNSIQPFASSSSINQRVRVARDDKEELATEKKYRCQWRECEMSLKRGTAEKKFEWLKTHFRTRHAPKSQPFKCLMSNCPIRFQSEKALHAHLLNSHDNRPTKKAPQQNTQSISCFDYTLPVRTESYGHIDFFDDYTFDLISKKVQKYYADSNNTVEKDLIDQDVQISCMTRKKTLNVLRKLFTDRMNRDK